MKIKIKRTAEPCETEISILCSKYPDQETVSLLRQLNLFTADITGYKDGETHRLSLTDVYYIDCADEKTFFYLEHDVYESPDKLYEWEERLTQTSFVRISKSAILNTDKLKSVRPLLGGKMEATMINGEKQVINRHYLPDFRKKFGI